MDAFGKALTKRTRALNLLRRIFTFEVLGTMLARKTFRSPVNSLWVHLMPSHYLFKAGSIRNVSRSGINYELDISDFMEHLVYFGYFDPAQEELFRLAEVEKAIVDVGVNIGSTMLNFARIRPERKVFGFEPNVTNYRKALRNLELNSFGNITLFNCGLGFDTRKVKLYEVDESNAGMNRILDSDRSGVMRNTRFSEIEIVRLDDFADINGFGEIGLIKIDVEGYELNVLKGAERLILRDKPTMFIEIDDNNLRAQGQSARELVQFVERFGYHLYRADSKVTVSSEQDFENCHFDLVCSLNN